MDKIILSTTTEFLAFDEESAYGIIEELRKTSDVEASSVKYKKETGKKMEHYIVTVKVRNATADTFVGGGE